MNIDFVADALPLHGLTGNRVGEAGLFEARKEGTGYRPARIAKKKPAAGSKQLADRSVEILMTLFLVGDI